MIQPAYYQNKISTFLTADQDQILGELANKHYFALDIFQKNAWIEQITNTKQELHDLQDGHIFFEFSIPRMGKRVDVLLVIKGLIYVVEYKVGARIYHRDAIDQVLDYALDLKNFHQGSHDKHIVPILVSTKADNQVSGVEWSGDQVAIPLLANGNNLGEIIKLALSSTSVLEIIDPDNWARSGYKPTPTIVEAAQALYQGHSVEEISRSDAGATNLTNTSKCISEIIALSQTRGRKSICFVTGVPGAGKTLAGLNISTQRLRAKEEESSVFLSGNGPLVIVLREALARDEVVRAKEKDQNLSKKVALSRVNAFIQNIHHFRDEGLKSSAAPVEHVVFLMRRSAPGIRYMRKGS